MLDGADQLLVAQWLERGPEIDPHHQLTIRSFKLFADGALGSRGAALLQPYSDAPQTKGVITTPESEVYQLARSSLKRGFQVCTHAIGDAANRMVLDAYASALKAAPNTHDPGCVLSTRRCWRQRISHVLPSLGLSPQCSRPMPHPT